MSSTRHSWEYHIKWLHVVIKLCPNMHISSLNFDLSQLTIVLSRLIAFFECRDVNIFSKFCDRLTVRSLLMSLIRFCYQVGGWSQVYKGLTLATVRGAGHEVPLHQPLRGLILFKHFLNNNPLPSGSNKNWTWRKNFRYNKWIYNRLVTHTFQLRSLTQKRKRNVLNYLCFPFDFWEGNSLLGKG